MHKVLNVMSKLVALFLSVILFFAISLFLIFDLFPKIINKENIETLISSYDAKEILGEDNKLIEGLYQIADENNVDHRIIDDIINSKEVNQLIGKYFGEVTELVLYNRKMEDITPSKIEYTIRTFLDRITYENGDILIKDLIMDVFSQKSIEIANLIPTQDELINSFSQEELQHIRVLFSTMPKIIIGLIILVIFILIGLVRWSLYKFAIWTGVTTIIVGLLFISSSSVFVSIMAPEYIGNISNSIHNLLENKIFNVMENMGIITTVIGTIQVMYYLFMRTIKKDY